MQPSFWRKKSLSALFLGSITSRATGLKSDRLKQPIISQLFNEFPPLSERAGNQEK